MDSTHDSQHRPTTAHKTQHSKAAAGGARDVTRLKPRYVFNLFLILLFYTTNIYLGYVSCTTTTKNDTTTTMTTTTKTDVIRDATMYVSRVSGTEVTRAGARDVTRFEPLIMFFFFICCKYIDSFVVSCMYLVRYITLEKPVETSCNWS